MDDWQKVIRSRARCGNFVGRGRGDEDAYYAFLDTADAESQLLHRIVSGTVARFRDLRARCALLIAHSDTKPSQ